MKFLAAALLLCGTAYAGVPDEPPTDPKGQYAAMVFCAASEAMLSHLNLEVAASIGSLSGEHMTPQLHTLMTGYKAMADDSKQRAKSYLDLVREVLIPALTPDEEKQEAILSKTADLFLYSTSRLATLLSNPDNEIDEQTTIERKLLDQSKSCETMATRLSGHKQSL
jgi:hypothetical protein